VDKSTLHAAVDLVRVRLESQRSGNKLSAARELGEHACDFFRRIGGNRGNRRPRQLSDVDFE
jgi:hypothetical protein